LWPGALFAVLQVLGWFVLPKVLPDQGIYGFFGTMIAALAIVLWWVFFSRARWSERLGILALMVVALVATYRILHPSLAQAGMGMMFIFYGVPMATFVLVAAAVVSHRLVGRARLAMLSAAVLLGSGGWALVRIDGIRGMGGSDFAWRWSPTPEERLLAQTADEPQAIAAPPALETSKELPAAKAGDKPAVPTSTVPSEERPAAASSAKASVVPSAPPAAEKAPEWPGFRGPGRDSIIRGARIETNWAASPPVELWRRPVGPGWSSFAVNGELLYTQEQRGEDEVVACYNAKTGEPVWRHRDAARFWEANAGAGPRATPTLHNGRVYTFGATGIVNALDARTGAVVWSRNAATDTGVKVPFWGFAGSPLVVGELVIVAASGHLAAYDLATGNTRWFGPKGGWGYSSPHLVTIDGVVQIVLLNGAGAISVAPADGALLWEHKWRGDGIVQPGLTADGGVLIGTNTGMGENAGVGMRRIAIARGPAGWTAEERWTSIALKPYFNDFVVHKGHAIGFDGGILACMDLDDGKRKWKGGRYGHGQLVLLAEQDLLLVLSEEGELALVSASLEQFTELARFPAIEGKTWNHPVLVGDLLLVRNDREMAAFRLARAGR
jgi:outer membrane protein assembly factor BamB